MPGSWDFSNELIPLPLALGNSCRSLRMGLWLLWNHMDQTKFAMVCTEKITNVCLYKDACLRNSSSGGLLGLIKACRVHCSAMLSSSQSLIVFVWPWGNTSSCCAAYIPLHMFALRGVWPSSGGLHWGMQPSPSFKTREQRGGGRGHEVHVHWSFGKIPKMQML